MSSVFLLEPDGANLSLGAGPNLPETWRRATMSVPVANAGACGVAASRGEQVIVPDISLEPLYESFREAADAAGLRAVVSTPFFSGDRRVLGTFAVYGPAPGHPAPRQLQLVDRATYLASIAVERHHTENALRESEVRFSRAFYANPA
jgi:GAF domain-containing protein